MAMHNSNELGEVAVLLFEQIKHLGIETYTSGFHIWDNNHKNVLSYMSNPTGSINPPFEMPIHNYEQYRRIYSAWKKKESFIEEDIKGKAIIEHHKFLRSFPPLDEAFKRAEKAGIKTPDRQVHNIATFSQGYLLFITLEPHPEFHDIFIRFAKVSKPIPASSICKKQKHKQEKPLNKHLWIEFVVKLPVCVLQKI